MTNSKAAFVAGRRLAIAMLREFSDLEPGDCSCEDYFRPDRSQRDVLSKYLEQVGSGGAEVRAGFCTVMNDFLAAREDIATDVEYYETLEADGYDRNAPFFEYSRAA